MRLFSLLNLFIVLNVILPLRTLRILLPGLAHLNVVLYGHHRGLFRLGSFPFYQQPTYMFFFFSFIFFLPC